MKILVIEDDEFFRKVVLQMLQRKGYEAKGAEDVRSGYAAAMREMPDVILADYRLPDGTGLDFFKSLSRLSSAMRWRYILMSASFLDVNEPLNQVLSAHGISCFLHKPFLISELQAALANPIVYSASNVVISANPA